MRKHAKKRIHLAFNLWGDYWQDVRKIDGTPFTHHTLETYLKDGNKIGLTVVCHPQSVDGYALSWLVDEEKFTVNEMKKAIIEKIIAQYVREDYTHYPTGA